MVSASSLPLSTLDSILFFFFLFPCRRSPSISSTRPFSMKSPSISSRDWSSPPTPSSWTSDAPVSHGPQLRYTEIPTIQIGCFAITAVFSHAQTVVQCASCATVLCQPTGGKARLTEGTQHLAPSHNSPPTLALSSFTRMLVPQKGINNCTLSCFFLLGTTQSLVHGLSIICLINVSRVLNIAAVYTYRNKSSLLSPSLIRALVHMSRSLIYYTQSPSGGVVCSPC
jgi:hypothetical protein